MVNIVCVPSSAYYHKIINFIFCQILSNPLTVSWKLVGEGQIFRGETVISSVKSVHNEWMILIKYDTIDLYHLYQ